MDRARFPGSIEEGIRAQRLASRPCSIKERVAPQGRMSLAFQSVAPGDDFEFTPDCVLNGDYGVHFEYK